MRRTARPPSGRGRLRPIAPASRDRPRPLDRPCSGTLLGPYQGSPHEGLALVAAGVQRRPRRRQGADRPARPARLAGQPLGPGRHRRAEVGRDPADPRHPRDEAVGPLGQARSSATATSSSAAATPGSSAATSRSAGSSPTSAAASSRTPGSSSIEDGEPVVYDTTKAGVRRQPFRSGSSTTSAPFGVKRLKPEYRRPHPQGGRVLPRRLREAGPVRLRPVDSTTASSTASR